MADSLSAGASCCNDEDESHEDSRLLQGGFEGQDQSAILKASKPLTSIIIYFMAIHFLFAFCEVILVSPLIRLFENSLCLEFYEFPVGGVEESRCKIPEIQRPLATIRGWKSMFDMLPVLLVAIPIGKFGDHYGRKKIMALSLLGVAGSLIVIFIVCAFPKIFPLQLVWLGSAMLFVGGGLNPASAYMWAAAAEAIPSARRSHAFYYICAAYYVGELVSSFVATVTTDISPWIPCSLAIGSVILCLLLLSVMPDTSNPPLSRAASPIPSRGSPKTTFAKRTLSSFSHRNTLLAIPVFLVGIFRYTTLNILIQYASIRFGIKVSQGAFFYTETALINITLFMFVVPQTTSYIRTKYNVRPQVIDLFLVRTCVCLMSAGALLIGMSPTKEILPLGVFVFAAGFGSRVSTLSLVSYWIPDEAKATLYATITVLESLGHSIGDPLMAQIFAASIKLATFWTAMPFFFAAALYFLAIVSTSLIHLGDSVEAAEEPPIPSSHEE